MEEIPETIYLLFVNDGGWEFIDATFEKNSAMEIKAKIDDSVIIEYTPKSSNG